MDRLAHKGMIRRLITGGQSLDEVERAYRYGIIPQDIWELYCSLWRNGAVRFSNELVQYDRPWKALAQKVIAESR